MGTRDEVVERVARAISEAEDTAEIPIPSSDIFLVLAKAALSALQPGDELPNGQVWLLAFEAKELARQTARQARIEERERIDALLAEHTGAGAIIGDIRAAIRALPGETSKED